MRARPRFPGAGASAEREFNRQLRQNIRESWRYWLALNLLAATFAAISLLTHGMPARGSALAAGILIGVEVALLALGGHISALHWSVGAEGERQTGKEIEQLGPEWHCEHDLKDGRGNWDHVLVGPPGLFLLDTKLLHRTATAGNDSLRAGKMVLQGRTFRSAAIRLRGALERQLARNPPWVQAVVIVWGDFPQARHEEQHVVYVRGEELRSWLTQLPERLGTPERAALVTAVQQLRPTNMKMAAPPVAR